MLIQDMRSRVAAAIGLDNTDGSTEQGLIDAWTNEACREFLERTKVFVEHATITLIPNISDYELPGSVLVLNTLEVTSALDGQVVPLEPIPIEELLWRRRYPGAVPVRYYAMQGTNLLSLYPTPVSADKLDIYYVPYPAVLQTDDDTSDAGIPIVFDPILEYWVKWRAGEYNDDGSSQNGQIYLQLFEAEIKKARGRIRRMQGRRRPAAIPGRRSRRRYYPAFPSQDTGGNY